MKFLTPKALMSLALFFTLPFVTARAAEDWKPVDPSHLSLKQPTVEKDADAEALFWEVRIADEDNGGEYRTVFNRLVAMEKAH